MNCWTNFLFNTNNVSISLILVICSKCRTFHKALVEQSPWAFDEAVKNEKSIDTTSSPPPTRYQLNVNVLIIVNTKGDGLGGYKATHFSHKVRVYLEKKSLRFNLGEGGRRNFRK